jgi:hypothetical protein
MTQTLEIPPPDKYKTLQSYRLEGFSVQEIPIEQGLQKAQLRPHQRPQLG